MTDYRAVMDLVLQGWSVRQICSTVRCSHTTVQKARHTMAAHQITTGEQLAGITDEEMATWFVDGRSGAQGDFVPIDFDAVAKARTGRNKVTLQVLWGRYTTQPVHPSQRYYSYERFRQLVAEHVDATGLTARITHAPGHTMQVDWAGTAMRLFDPTDARGAKVSIFVASLPYSGMLFACACPNQRQQAVASLSVV
ncbi:helix-turn-helix domain-containing protein [uncultured Corynebacterium sp.]|uniref:helix-turn-helix domain-containing protein n=1 Tax=uncultured Corynebacterium sp. TaxID=159447 RepID=UPI00259A87D3|nr:helix-turn-helix domain-containing protein [uncultured Corynebacterium sp.]